MYKWTAVNWMHVLLFVVMVIAASVPSEQSYVYAGFAFGIFLGTLLERTSETSRRLMTRIRLGLRRVGDLWPFR